MARRWSICLMAVLLLSFLPWGTVEAGLPEPQAPEAQDTLLCRFALLNPLRGTCPRAGRVTGRAFTPVRLPDPLPELAVSPAGGYAQVVKSNAPVYGHPIEALYGLAPRRTLGDGFVFVSVQGVTTYEGRDFYQINPGEYVPAGTLAFYNPSSFQGVALAEPPAGPFAWVLRAVQPLRAPAGEVNAEAPVYQRYQTVQIQATQQTGESGERVWYQIGPEQWIEQIYVAKVTPVPPPPGVPPGALWIEVDLFEQTLAAYAGDRMLYATLVSSGLPGWDTPTGLFQVWLKVASGKMSGAYDRPDYYFLEDVPWAIYFKDDVALHGAYWHHSFGYRHSHGCVNLAPQDAQWLFERVPEGTWVWVH